MVKSVIGPRIKGFICTTAHPAGCAAHVLQQIDEVKSRPRIQNGPKNVLIIGASTGYGLASRIVAAFGAGANTLGVFFERPAQGDRTASAGWYNSVAFEKFALESHLLARSINGDAFSDEIKQKTIALLKKDFGKVDLVIYSLASPRRTHPRTGETYRSALKPIGNLFSGKTVNTDHGTVNTVTLEPATDEEIEGTIAVMGGEDWELWLDALQRADVLAENVQTVAYSYIGPEMTWAIYKNGTIGKAKADLDVTVSKIDKRLIKLSGKAHIAVNKGVVTQASSAIPVVPLYISLLFKVMKAKGLHEDCIQQMYRLFADRLYGKIQPLATDGDGRIRLDDWEMGAEIQRQIGEIWPQLTSENLRQLTDFDGYQENFLRLFGFGLPDINYAEPVEIEVNFED